MGCPMAESPLAVGNWLLAVGHDDYSAARTFRGDNGLDLICKSHDKPRKGVRGLCGGELFYKANPSPILELFLLRIDDLIARVSSNHAEMKR